MTLLVLELKILTSLFGHNPAHQLTKPLQKSSSGRGEEGLQPYTKDFVLACKGMHTHKNCSLLSTGHNFCMQLPGEEETPVLS